MKLNNLTPMEQVIIEFIKAKNTTHSDYVEVLVKCCSLQSANSDYNLIKIKTGSKELDATSIKLYNLLKVEQKELWQALLKIVPQGVLLKDVTDYISLVASFFLLLLEFKPLAEYKFSETEARFLLVLYFLEFDAKQLDVSSVISKYMEVFGDLLTEEAVKNTFGVLQKLEVGNMVDNLFLLEEEIYLER